MRDNKWVQLPACVTGLVNQRLIPQNEYLAAESRILRSHLPFPARWAKETHGTAPDRASHAQAAMKATDVSHLSVNPLTVRYREITGKSSHVALRVS
jgi:hypothetical protein